MILPYLFITVSSVLTEVVPIAIILLFSAFALFKISSILLSAPMMYAKKPTILWLEL